MNNLSELLDAIDAIKELRELRYELKKLHEERAALYSFCPLKEGDLAVVTEPLDGWKHDPSVSIGSTGTIRRLEWHKGAFHASFAPTFRWGVYSNKGSGTYVRERGPTYLLPCSALAPTDTPQVLDIGCRHCDWVGTSESVPDDGRCPGCDNRYVHGRGETALYVVIKTP